MTRRSVRIDLKIERRPPAFGRTGDHAREQRRAHFSAHRRRSVQFRQRMSSSRRADLTARRSGDANQQPRRLRRQNPAWLDTRAFNRTTISSTARRHRARELNLKQSPIEPTAALRAWMTQTRLSTDRGSSNRAVAPGNSRNLRSLRNSITPCGDPAPEVTQCAQSCRISRRVAGDDPASAPAA